MDAPRIHASDAALARIRQVRDNRRAPHAGVRIDIVARRDGEFVYDLQLAPPGDAREGDVAVDGDGGIRYHVPQAAAAYLDGITLDADAAGALRVVNPNPLWFDRTAREIQEFLDDEVNPMVASHGGVIDLLDVRNGVAWLRMGGGCQGCSMADATLSQGVRTAILERFPDVHDVRDATDHAQGTNPYYSAHTH